MKTTRVRALLLKVLWGGAVLSLGIMIILSHILAGRVETPSSINILRLVFIALAAVHWLLAVLVPDWLAVKALSLNMALSSFLLSGFQRSSTPPAEPNLFSVYVLRYAVLNAMGVFGLMLAILGERIEYAYVFCGVALLGLLLRRPSTKVTEQA